LENVYIAYNFSHFAIYLPKCIKICGNLTNFWQKQKCSFFETPSVYKWWICCVVIAIPGCWL